MSVTSIGSQQALAKLNGNPNREYPNSRRRALSYLLELQTSMVGETLKPSEQARDKAACARVWKDLEELRLTLTGFGRPKTVEAKNTPKSAKSKPKHSGMIDPGATQPSPVATPLATPDSPVPVPTESPVFEG
jgi:hypothetical protein